MTNPTRRSPHAKTNFHSSFFFCAVQLFVTVTSFVHMFRELSCLLRRNSSNLTSWKVLNSFLVTLLKLVSPFKLCIPRHCLACTLGALTRFFICICMRWFCLMGNLRLIISKPFCDPSVLESTVLIFVKIIWSSNFHNAQSLATNPSLERTHKFVLPASLDAIV